MYMNTLHDHRPLIAVYFRLHCIHFSSRYAQRVLQSDVESVTTDELSGEDEEIDEDAAFTKEDEEKYGDWFGGEAGSAGDDGSEEDDTNDDDGSDGSQEMPSQEGVSHAGIDRPDLP